MAKRIYFKLLSFLVVALFIGTSCNNEDTLCDESTWYLDADGDGLGDPNVSFSSCEAPSGYVTTQMMKTTL